MLRHDAGGIAGFDNAQIATAVAMIALLIFLSGAVRRGYRGRIGQALQDAVTWAAIGLALVAGYTYRDHIVPVVERVAGELVPGTPVMVESDTPQGLNVRIRRQRDGHFVAQTHVNGVPMRMIVDTGASTVVLRLEDAVRIGIEPERLVYSVPVQTAAGRAFAARIRLDRVAVGSLTVRNVEAMVAQPGALHQSLLGMTFLSRLRSYEFSGDFLTLRS